MEVRIEKNDSDDICVTIACRQVNDSVRRLKKYIALFDECLVGKCAGEVWRIPVTEILYIESVDNRTFLYTADRVSEIEQRLYELENMLNKKDFFRNSKSQILNINKISRLKPELNRTVRVTMCNEEILYISRRYSKEFKQILGI